MTSTNTLHRHFARIAELHRQGLTPFEQAAALGFSRNTLNNYRTLARKAGYDVGDRRPRSTFSDQDDARLAAIEAGMGGPPCERDGLRGPHRCVSATDYMRSGQEAASLSWLTQTPRRRAAA
jgi:hypothetical protein